MTARGGETLQRLRALAASADGAPHAGARRRCGDVVADRFEIDQPIGEGGMGVVYRALDRQSRAVVALKLVRIGSAAEEERFAREARAVAGLAHPGVVRYVAHGVSSGDERFLATELLVGRSLADRLARGALAIADAITVGRRAAEALAAAHGAGIVHRDVKPSNLFLVDDDPERVVLLDFGVARPRDALGVTRTGTVLGTACYVAPEQVRSSRDVDARADVFALGLVLYECLVGRAAFSADDTEGALTKVLLEEPPRLGTVRAETPPALEELVVRMVDKNVEARPRDAAAVVAELSAIEAPPPSSAAHRRAGMIGAGDVIAGKYEVERVLGEGGMGVVVAARHIALDRRVAIKLLRATTPSDEARFLREAQAASRLDSDHAVRVIDFGGQPEPYMVMELLEGADLAQVLSERGALPAPVAVEYVLQAAEALAEAHARGVVHRDIKPSNLFLTIRADGTPHVKVLDFGISKRTDASVSSSSLTAPAAVLGSPRYMSPEQLKSARDVDVRADVWGLGAVLYELVAGRPAFDAPTAVALAARIASEPPEPLEPGVPAALARVAMRCLAKDPADRYRTIGELAAALRAATAAASPARWVGRSAFFAAAVVALIGAAALVRSRSGSHAAIDDAAAAAPIAGGPSVTGAPAAAAAQSAAAAPNAAAATPLDPPRDTTAAVVPAPAEDISRAARRGSQHAPRPAVSPSVAPPAAPSNGRASSRPRATVDPLDPALEGR